MSLTSPVLNVKPTMDPAVAQGVLKSVFEMERAWNAHDMQAYADNLTDDCQWVNIVGMFWDGKTAVHRAHEAFHQTMFKDVGYKVEEVMVRSIATSVAIAVVTLKVGAFTTPGGTRMPENTNRLTLVLVDEGGQWRISSAQNTVVDMRAAGHDPTKG